MRARLRLGLRLALLAGVMAALFAVDTATNYEVAAAVFYAMVVLTAAPFLGRRALIRLSAFCVALTVLSFALTPKGNMPIGLANMGVSIAAIVMTAWLILKMDAARQAAQDAHAKLVRIARIKSLEGLTTSIAHEINQPLAAIVTSGNACGHWLAHDPPNLDRARQALERIVRDAGRASAIVARVRSLTRGEPPSRTVFAFNDAVGEVVGVSRGEIERYGIALVLDLAPDLPAVRADRVQVQQVIGNLLLNAIEAIAAGPARARTIHMVSEVAGGMVRLSICDSGIGIPAGIRDHLFEAFWTTKEDGMGIGLSISRTLVEANGGEISAEPVETGGATIRFTVPAVQQEKS
ncbi:sensor histidine kinase [Gluconacetobacter sp.]|uniref:sensor histidine kinase n=1 Tax=Gluconacetobacter sp. TaxID=1935994 RepID=UPI0039EB1BE9